MVLLSKLAMLNLRFRYRFEAAHRFLKSSSIPCMTPHGHSWHGTLQLKYLGHELNENAMAVNFSEIKGDWRRLLTETLDHSYLHNWQDPVVAVLKESHPEARLLPFPADPTTELLSVLLFHKMETLFAKSAYKKQLQVDAILIEETQTNQILCGRDFYQQQIRHYKDFHGWWMETTIDDRSLAKK